ncbi:MAG: ABC transporter ATP-binding protein [Desulfobacteraceae bacterium]|nr:ABC transporter ATP-binding protein [Desulfobacteraceae bacterium]
MIHVEELTKYYNDFCAVDHIRFDVNRGEILGLLGPNGAGKTTTLKMLTGFFPPSDGEIRINDLTVTENPLEIKQMLGYLPESSPFYRDMLVYDYLSYVAAVRGISSDKIPGRLKYLAELCGLSQVMHKAVGELSKGLNQRVGLAHAMMNDPEILILDEPTQGLDPNQIAEIRSLIKKIGEEKTIIFSTHILSEAEATCDRIMIIDQGKIVADDATEALKHGTGRGALLHVSLKNADPEHVRATIESIDGVESVRQSGAETDEAIGFNIRCSPRQDLRESVYKAIKQTDWTLLDFHQEAQTLESIFSSLTRQVNKEN